MPSFSKTSLDRLNTCHADIRRVMFEVVKWYDCKVLYGHRDPMEQQELFIRGKTKCDGVTNLSYHNYEPSLAIDVVPYPVMWPDAKGLLMEEVQARLRRFYTFGGFVLGVARTLNVSTLYWGGDWDFDWDLEEHTFRDLPHFELRGVPTPVRSRWP